MEMFLTALTALAPAMRFEMTTEILAAYELTLSKYPEEELLACIPELGLCDFFPRPSDFKRLIDPDGPTIEDRANAAWSNMKVIACNPATGHTLDELTINAMQGIIDFHMIRNASEKELRGYGFEFRARYRVLAEQQKNDDTRALIKGRAANLIGDAAKSLGMGE